MGDVDLNGKITAKDALLIMRNTVKLYDFSNIQEFVANVNSDEKVTNADALVILRYTVNLKASDKVGKKVYYNG